MATKKKTAPKRPTAAAMRELVAIAREIEGNMASELRYHDGRLTVHAPEDPAVAALGARIGFGALMSATAKEWRGWLKMQGMPDGSEFLPGQCAAVARSRLRQLRAALASVEGSTRRARGK